MLRFVPWVVSIVALGLFTNGVVLLAIQLRQSYRNLRKARNVFDASDAVWSPVNAAGGMMILGPGMTVMTGSELTEAQRHSKAFDFSEPTEPHCPVCWGKGATQLLQRRHTPGTTGQYTDIWCADQWHADWKEAHRTKRRPKKVV